VSDEGLRVALLRIAQDHADVAVEIGQRRKQENSIVLRFGKDAVEAEKAIHSLGRLRESQKYERSGEVSRPAWSV